MGDLLIQEKDIVVPGQVLASGMDFLPASGTFREGDNVVSLYVGLVNVNGRLIRVIPLKGKYAPKRGDTVIGKIVDMSFNSWFVDIDGASDAILSVRDISEYVERGADLTQYYSFGDYIVAKIANVTRSAVELTMKDMGLRKLGKGRIMRVNSSKVPRIIGKQGSMISMVKEKTGCRITVGQNGLIWIQGSPEHERVVADIIALIDRESHKEGLTDRVGVELDKLVKDLPRVESTHTHHESAEEQEKHYESSEKF